MLDAGGKSDGHGMLAALEHIISKVFVPSLCKLQQGWGKMEGEDTSQAKRDFINSLSSFAEVLAGT